MRKIFVFFILVVLLTGCGANNREKAIGHLLSSQKKSEEISIIVFSKKSLEESFIRDLQTNVDYINNHIRIEDPIINVSLINIKDDQTYNYEKIFDLQRDPQIILFQNNDVLLEPDKPEDIRQYFEKQKQ